MIRNLPAHLLLIIFLAAFSSVSAFAQSGKAYYGDVYGSSEAASSKKAGRGKPKVAGEKRRSYNSVTLVVSGRAKDEKTAIDNALRSAVEQAYGTFVSAGTTVEGDCLVRDAIATVSNGSIQSYEKIRTTDLGNGQVEVLLRAKVSLKKLATYVKGRGSSVDVGGEVFAIGVKLKELNRRNEYEALVNLLEQIRILGATVLNYEMSAKEPMCYNKDPLKDENRWGVEINVEPSWNKKNIRMLTDLITKTFESLSLRSSEIRDYKRINLAYFEWNIDGKAYYLRNPYRILDPLMDQIVESLNRSMIAWRVEQKCTGGDRRDVFRYSLPTQMGYEALTYRSYYAGSWHNMPTLAPGIYWFDIEFYDADYSPRNRHVDQYRSMSLKFKKKEVPFWNMIVYYTVDQIEQVAGYEVSGIELY